MNKKSQSSFLLSDSLGYFILSLMLISILLIFLSFLVTGVDVNFFKSNYGSSVINMEDRFFNLVEYKEEFIFQKYTKVLDLNKLNSFAEDEDCKGLFSRQFGTNVLYSSKGIKAEISFEGYSKIISSCNYYDSGDNFKKKFLVLITDGDIKKLGEVTLYFWKP